MGEHEHTVVVEGGETHTLYLPIVPITLGTITIRVQASVKGRKLQEQVIIFVEVKKDTVLNYCDKVKTP